MGGSNWRSRFKCVRCSLFARFGSLFCCYLQRNSTSKKLLPTAHPPPSIPCTEFPLLLLRYADLVADPEAEMARVGWFLAHLRPEHKGGQFGAMPECVRGVQGGHKRPRSNLTFRDYLQPDLLAEIRNITEPMYREMTQRVRRQKEAERRGVYPAWG